MEEYLINKVEPHFYYNALEYINSMAIINDIPEISEVAISLGKMMRYWTDRNGKWINVNYELNYINEYLIISKLRYENIFEFEIIKNIHENKKCPIYILEPIINEVILNVAGSDTMKKIVINVSSLEEKLEFKILIENTNSEKSINRKLKEDKIHKIEERLIELTGSRINIDYNENHTRISYKI